MSDLPRRRAFELTERPLGPDTRGIDVAGELEMAVADQLREALERATEAVVLVGLRDCDFLDSTGIAVIVRAQMVMAREGRRLLVHGPSREALRILSMAGLTDSGLVFEDARQALTAAQPAARKSDR
jgi:anti-anti-sigma factor